jgi:hypothetical protein
MHPNERSCRAAALALITALTLPAGSVLGHDAPEPADTVDRARGGPSFTGSVTTGDLGHIVYPISTIIEYADGAQTLNRGSGFVIGTRFYTVNHNLETKPGALAVSRVIYVEGTRVRPAVLDAAHDIAIFELPPELCARICNRFALGPMPALDGRERVFWLRKFGEEHVLKDARVLSYAVIGTLAPDGGQRAPSTCEHNLVVQVDAPFIQGTSGSPVVDARSGRVIGIAQGSFEYRGVRTGYFKPINCVQRLGDTIASAPELPPVSL